MGGFILHLPPVFATWLIVGKNTYNMKSFVKEEDWKLIFSGEEEQKLCVKIPAVASLSRDGLVLSVGGSRIPHRWVIISMTRSPIGVTPHGPVCTTNGSPVSSPTAATTPVILLNLCATAGASQVMVSTLPSWRAWAMLSCHVQHSKSLQNRQKAQKWTLA